jgi:hypothetical protein
MKTPEDELRYVAENAAMIASELPPSLVFPWMDNLVQTARNLATLEMEPDFDWEAAREDWESICARCAEHLQDYGVPTIETIWNWIYV